MKRHEVLFLRLQPANKAHIEAQAKKAGVSANQYVDKLVTEMRA